MTSRISRPIVCVCTCLKDEKENDSYSPKKSETHRFISFEEQQGKEACHLCLSCHPQKDPSEDRQVPSPPRWILATHWVCADEKTASGTSPLTHAHRERRTRSTKPVVYLPVVGLFGQDETRPFLPSGLGVPYIHIYIPRYHITSNDINH